MMLDKIEPKEGKVFTDTNLRTEWECACAACGLGTREKRKAPSGFTWHKYSGLIVHDLRRSAVRNLVNCGVPENVVMKITGHKTRAVFLRYAIASTDDVANAMRRLETASLADSAKLVQKRKKPSRQSAQLIKSKSVGA